MLGTLYQISQAWREKKDAGDTSLTKPLRTILLQSLLTELEAQALPTKAEALAVAKQNQWLCAEDTQLLWIYQVCNPTTSTVQVNQTRDPLTQDAILKILHTLGQLMGQENVLHKFRSTRPLAASMQTNQAVFLLQVGLKETAAHEAHSLLKQLCDLAVLRMVSWRLRPARLTRTPLAKDGALAAARVRNLVLSNPHHHCYMNSWMFSWLWLLRWVPQHEAVMSQVFGGLRSLLDAQRPGALMQSVLLRMLLQGWVNSTMSVSSACSFSRRLRFQCPTAGGRPEM